MLCFLLDRPHQSNSFLSVAQFLMVLILTQLDVGTKVTTFEWRSIRQAEYYQIFAC